MEVLNLIHHLISDFFLGIFYFLEEVTKSFLYILNLIITPFQVIYSFFTNLTIEENQENYSYYSSIFLNEIILFIFVICLILLIIKKWIRNI